MAIITLDKIEIGRLPMVVGTVSDRLTLSSVGENWRQRCDIAEVRYDLIESKQAEVFKFCADLAKIHIPIIFTNRIENEGGNWSGSEIERQKIFEKFFDPISLIDIEIQSPLYPGFINTIKRANKSVISSYHNFLKTPDFQFLSDLIREASIHKPVVVKISTLIQTKADINTMLRILECDWEIPVCLLGMGQLGACTRIFFPIMGSCLTYGFLDTMNAPGQLSSEILKSRLLELHPQYNEEIITESHVMKYS